jgi:heme A synthase
MKLKLSAPKTITFIIALVMAVVGLLIAQGILPALLFAPIWWALIAFAILALGNLLKGM